LNLMLVYNCPVHGIILQDKTHDFEGNVYCECSRLVMPELDDVTLQHMIVEVPEEKLFAQMGIEYNVENELKINE